MALKRPTGEALAAVVADRTGYVFADLMLMQTALTHSSAPGARDNNERLEFLGDRVLSLVISDLLLSSFPDAREGELAVRLNALVRGDTCAEVAADLKLEQIIRADSAIRSGTSKARNVLADAVEALIAAITWSISPARNVATCSTGPKTSRFKGASDASSNAAGATKVPCAHSLPSDRSIRTFSSAFMRALWPSSVVRASSSITGPTSVA